MPAQSKLSHEQRQWIADHQGTMTQVAMAALLGVTQATISRALPRGDRDMGKRTRYAEGTGVDAAASQADIKRMLLAAGSGEVREYTGADGRGVIGFELNGRKYRLDLPPVDRQEVELTPSGKPRNPEAAERAFRAINNARWRALCLAVKAKLVSIQEGITTAEAEFLANMVLRSGQTVLEANRRTIELDYQTAGDIPLLPPN